MDDLQPGLPSIEVDTTIFRPATFIEQSIDNLTQGAADRHPARDPDHHRLPVRVANGVHQPDRDPAVAARRDPRARPARRDDQRDGARGIGRRDRGGGRRRDHRRGEHRATSASGARGGQRGLDLQGRARRLGRGAKRHHLRDADQRRGGRAGVLPRGPLRLVLPAARDLLRPGGAGLDAGRADGHAGALSDHAVEGPAAAPRVAAAAGAEARLRGDPRARHPQAAARRS